MSLAPSCPIPVTIIGSYVSPFVRKVLVCLDLKRVPYLIDPITPDRSVHECCHATKRRPAPLSRH